jgi:predicted DNA-binding ribbon-helix-helix protein
MMHRCGEVAMEENDDSQRKPVRTTATIPAEDYAELEKIAEQKKVSVAWVIREAVDKYLRSQSPLFRKP